MEYFERFGSAAAVDELGEKIVKFYQKFGDSISITDWNILNDRMVFQIKLKGSTRKAHIYAHASDVQQRLKLPIFQIVERNFLFYIIASDQVIKSPDLEDVLQCYAKRVPFAEYALPYVIGHDPIGRLVCTDLVKLNHLLIGGSSNSGKTVNLRALIASIAYMRTPSQVNFVLIDVGANDLQLFSTLPHLSCPVISTIDSACNALACLNKELKRRIALERSNPAEFSNLPRIVLVIDEYPALFAGTDKRTSQFMSDIISGFLQRGRHARIHLVIAAQNPTLKNMKADLGNITARIAFKCAKGNYSETILGESGAELLSGAGDLLFRSPLHDGLQRVQGIYLKRADLMSIVARCARHYKRSSQMFTISTTTLDAQEPQAIGDGTMLLQPLPSKPLSADRRFAEIVLWALSRNNVSINALMAEHGLGWKKASHTIRRMEELGIVEPLDGKQPRHVIPTVFDDLTDNLISFLHQNGVEEERLIKGIASR